MAVISLDLWSVLTCPSTRPVGTGKCAHHVDGRPLAVGLGRAQGLAVHGYHLSLAQVGDRADPLGKAALIGLAADGREDPAEGVLGGYAVGQFQEFLGKVFS